jgi:hypothetical protein
LFCPLCVFFFSPHYCYRTPSSTDNVSMLMKGNVSESEEVDCADWENEIRIFMLLEPPILSCLF